MKTITRRYRTFEDARNVVVRLSKQGIPAGRMGLVGRQETGEDNTVAAAGVGSAAGAATGFPLSLGALALPGVGPVIVAGWFFGGAAAGALAGGVAGALIDAGLSPPEAQSHVDDLRTGTILVAVRAEPSELAEIARLMDVAQPVTDPSRKTCARDEPQDLSNVVS